MTEIGCLIKNDAEIIMLQPVLFQYYGKLLRMK